MSQPPIFNRMIQPPSLDRNIYQRYPSSGGFGGAKDIRSPFVLLKDEQDAPTCNVGTWRKTLPKKHPRNRHIAGSSTVKHIYGTTVTGADGADIECTTGEDNNYDMYNYIYRWVPDNTSIYDSSAPLGPDCPNRSKREEYRLGEYLDPSRAFRTQRVLLYPANGRYEREPRLYTNYRWKDADGKNVTTPIHPRADLGVKPYF